MGIGVMRDYKLKLSDLNSHKLLPLQKKGGNFFVFFFFTNKGRECPDFKS